MVVYRLRRIHGRTFTSMLNFGESKAHAPVRYAVLPSSLLLCLLLLLAGCASSNGGGCGSGGTTQSLTITLQPASQSIPMGLTASFSVATSGSGPLNYQWNKDGTPIDGATSGSYSTPAVQFADTGSQYSVIITNSVSTVTSNPATLTVTARAPQADDLRFQQVDAASTVNGYSPASALSTVLFANGTEGGGQAYTFGNATGTPLFVMNDPGSWQFFPWVSAESTGLQTGYFTDQVSNFQSDLGETSSGPIGTLNAPNTVITSVSFVPSIDWFALSWIRTTQAGGFDMAQHTVAPSDFQAAATQEGENSRVITAVSYNAGQVFYLSYGWQGDTATAYDVQVANATIQTAATVVSNLAAQGYILTAIGGEGNTDGSGILLVGTRVRGDTLPRPVMVVPLSGDINQLLQQGYAVVGVAQFTQDNNLVQRDTIGER